MPALPDAALPIGGNHVHAAQKGRTGLQRLDTETAAALLAADQPLAPSPDVAPRPAIALDEEVLLAGQLAHGYALCATARMSLALLHEEGGQWHLEQSIQVPLNDLAVGAQGRIVALAFPSGDTTALHVWAATSRGLVKTGGFILPVRELHAHDQRILVQTEQDGWYELINLDETASAAEASASSQAYPAVSLELLSAAESYVQLEDRRKPGQFARPGGGGTVGLRLCEPSPAVLDEWPASRHLFGSENVQRDGEHEWGWSLREDGNYVFAWIESGALRVSRLVSRNPGLTSQRRGDGRAFLVETDEGKVWEVQTETGQPTLVCENRMLIEIAYVGPAHVWVQTPHFVEVYERHEGRFVRQQQARWSPAKLHAVDGDRALLIADENEDGEDTIKVVVVAPAGLFVADEVPFTPITLTTQGGHVYLAPFFEPGNPVYELTHLDEVIEQAMLDRRLARFELPETGSFSLEEMLAIEEDIEPDEVMPPGSHARPARRGHVGLDWYGRSYLLPLTMDPSPTREDNEALDTVELCATGKLAWGWRREHKRWVRLVWIEGGKRRESTLVNQGVPSRSVVSFDRQTILTTLGQTNRALWAVDRTTGQGRLLHEHPDSPIHAVTAAAHGRVLFATEQSCGVHTAGGVQEIREVGGWKLQELAAGAQGRIVALRCGEGAGLRVWASTTRGLVSVDAFDLPVKALLEHEQRLFVQTTRDEWYELTNLEEAARVAEESAGQGYPLVGA